MSLRYAILGLLAQEAGSGYDLMGRFTTSVANVWPASQSQVYSELGKLAEKGFIEVTGVGARNRKEYAIKQEGRVALQEWLSHPAPGAVRSAALLQVFLLSEVNPSQARGHLDAMAQRAAGQVARLELLDEDVAWDDAPRDTFSRMALEYGIRQARTEMEWALEMRDRL